MKELIEYIVKELVVYKEEVIITQTKEDTILTINIKVDPTDKGRIIGKGGKVINSIRNIAKTRAIKDSVKVYVEIE